MFLGKSNSGQNMGRLHGSAGTGGAAGDGEPGKVQRDHHRFAFNPVETNIRRVGNARSTGTVDVSIGNAIQNGLLQPVTQPANVRLRQAAGFGEPGGHRHAFRPGTAVAFMPSAEGDLMERHSLPDVQRSDPLRAIDLMGREAAQRSLRQIGLFQRLHAIGMDRDSKFQQIVDGLDRSQFVVDGHHADQVGFRTQRRADVGGVDHAAAGDSNDGDVRKLLADVENRRMLDGGRNHVARLQAENRQVVRFGTAAGKHDLFGLCASSRGDGTARVLQQLLRPLSFLVDTGSVPESFTPRGGHTPQNIGVNGRCRVVIEISATHNSSMPRPIITLTTDFGLSDHFVGAMKGVILTIAPNAEIVDISHELPPYSISEACFLVGEATPWFPKKTIHVVVIDPGVGSARRPILVEAAGQYFIGPDNGVFSMVRAAAGKSKVREITNPKWMLPKVSRTFHGRDIFAPAGAHLAQGASPSQAGKLIADALQLRLAAPEQTNKRAWTGTVLKIDRFGNMITNFKAADFDRVRTGPFELAIGFERLSKLATNYAEGEYGELFVIEGSSGYLEISANQAHAAKKLGCGVGAPVELTLY